MKDTSEQIIEKLVKNQKDFFSSHQTMDLKFRINMLKQFKASILKYEKKITDALWIDLHKSYKEAYLTEISIVLQEINYHLKKIRCWSRPKPVSTPLQLLPSRSRIYHEPLGVALIVSPWNYPFQLLMNPLVGAISAGCCAVLKPSPYTPHVAQVMEELIRETFDEKYIGIVQGGREVNTILFNTRFDMIFYTGSPSVGKVVMKAASAYLTPVVLELGGKSPCIVDKDANLDIAAKRIAWGKTINAGQTCIAPDYLMAHESVKEALIEKICFHIEKMFGPDIKQSEYFPRIVNDKAFDRLTEYLKQGLIRCGGETDRDERFIAPVILDDVKPDDTVMQDEIFGPILPVMTFRHIDEALSFVNARQKPLAFYYFGNNHQAKNVLLKTTSGGACINDTIMHIVNHKMPFGGVGNSGLGKYHGHYSFLAFSNQRAVVKTPPWIDLPFKYVPFKYFNWIKRIL